MPVQVEIKTSPLAFSCDELAMLLPRKKFDQLLSAISLAKNLFDEAEANLLRGAAAEWTPQELEQYVGYCEPEPEAPASPQYVVKKGAL
jgi:hypothetical protein